MPAILIMVTNDFTIDKVEYQSVFKVFDKENKGTIHIDTVNSYIQMFEEVQIAPSEKGEVPKKGRELPVKNT